VRRGFSLHELLISLTVMSAVFALATHFALRQTRFFRGIGEADAVRSQLTQVTEVVRNVVANVSPSTGELLVALDTALEVRLTIGTAFVCSATPGSVVFPAPVAALGGSAAAFVRAPEPGDRLSTLFSDSLGAVWLHLQVASAPVLDGPCAWKPGIDTTWSITTAEPMSLPAGAALRFTRPLRLSLYRSSDERWYLGAKDWNGEAQRFNTIQPVAGPLQGHADRAGAGLRLVYSDAQGRTLADPVDVDRVASVRVEARASGDSMIVVVRLPNAR
jgi:prepilin-type N-terminal cleavage/methylation domain-containing protein